MENAYISTVIVVIIFLHISMEIIYIVVISEWTKNIHNHIWPERGCLTRKDLILVIEIRTVISLILEIFQ